MKVPFRLLKPLLIVAGALAFAGCSGAGTTHLSVTSDTLPTAGATATVAAPSSGGEGSVAVGGDDFPGTLVLGRPTDTSATISLLAETDMTFRVEYGNASGSYSGQTDKAEASAGLPVEVSLAGLQPDTTCFYRVAYTATGQADENTSDEYSFHTQRASGSSFTFAVEADPHIDKDAKMQPELFRQALAGIAVADPDFLIDLGDTFLGDKFARDYPTLDAQYANTRGYFGIIGPSVPLYLANGNHDGESGWALDGTQNNLAVWATTARKKYYPNPYPDGFYSGDTSEQPFAGQRESYYAWEWGDALFVVLDPYYWTPENPKQSGDLWDYTLGTEQYRWLEETLRTSGAKYKFVFSHHVLGDVRGGIEWAGLYEWGGADKNGIDQFAKMRPGWELPIHQLFVKYGVDIYFQGHDHFFVKQELDGVVYQEVPQPATPGGDAQNMAHEYAYKSGTVLASPGYLLVTVSSSGVQVDYIQLSGATAATAKAKKGGTPSTDAGNTATTKPKKNKKTTTSNSLTSTVTSGGSAVAGSTSGTWVTALSYTVK
jgi:hypothetical protein